MSCTCQDAVGREAREIAQSVGSTPEKAIPLLQEIQNRHGYLPEDLVVAVADVTKIPLSELYGVATFYSQFRFEPRGEYLIKICKGTACHVAGAEQLASTITDELKINDGETTGDRKYSLESVACLGCCSLAPVVMINEKLYGKLTAAKMKKILKDIP